MLHKKLQNKFLSEDCSLNCTTIKLIYRIEIVNSKKNCFTLNLSLVFTCFLPNSHHTFFNRYMSNGHTHL